MNITEIVLLMLVVVVSFVLGMWIGHVHGRAGTLGEIANALDAVKANMAVGPMVVVRWQMRRDAYEPMKLSIEMEPEPLRIAPKPERDRRAVVPQ